MKREEAQISPDEWAESGLTQEAPNGTKVRVLPTKDGKSFLIQLETPIDGEEPDMTELAVSEATLATMMKLIMLQTGLWIPGFGTLRMERRDGEAE
jgi:hypothetical protein